MDILRDEWLWGTPVSHSSCGVVSFTAWSGDQMRRILWSTLLCVLDLSTSSHCSFLLEFLCIYTSRAFPLFSVSRCSGIFTRSLGDHTVMVAKPFGGPVSTWDVVLNFWSACVWDSDFLLFFAPVPCVFLSLAPTSRSFASVVTRVYLPLLGFFPFSAVFYVHELKKNHFQAEHGVRPLIPSLRK